MKNRPVPSLPPQLTMLNHVLRYRAARFAEARRRRDVGALSIEMSLLIIGLIAVAGIVVVAVTHYVNNQTSDFVDPNTSAAPSKG